jgi:hypothetical protein
LASVNRVNALNSVNGIFIKGVNGVDATVKDSVAAGNGPAGTGFRADNASSMDLEHCVTTDNNFGVTAQSGAVVRVSNSTITANGNGLFGSGTILSRGNNTLEGNGTDGTFDGAVTSK